MNTHNNKRKKESIAQIEKVFINLIQNKELNEISVSEICKLRRFKSHYLLCKLPRYLRTGRFHKR